MARFKKPNHESQFIEDLKNIVDSARKRAYAAINLAQVEANWLIGQRIVVQEQNGKARAEYGKRIIAVASQELTAEFGKGFSARTLRQFRQFYLMFPELPIRRTLFHQSGSIEDGKTQLVENKQNDNLANNVRRISSESFQLLSWSHIQRIMRVQNKKARAWYMKESAEQAWAYQTLDRNINSQYYERILLSQNQQPVEDEMKEITRDFQRDKLAFIKNPTVLEFLGLPGNAGYMERDLENAIIENLQKFLLELGKGFSFVARQQLIRTEAENYFIDLVFYNYILKCFVLIDVKTTKITHQDVGQMDMYIRMYDELKLSEGDNPTIGIVLCSETDHDIARYSVLHGNEQLFASKYKMYLPTEEELRTEIERQKEFFMLQQAEKEERK